MAMRKAFSIVLLIVVLAFVGLLLSFPVFYVTPVITYHSISEVSGVRSWMNTVSSRVFGEQMGFLADRGYHVLSMDEYVKQIRFLKPHPSRLAASAKMKAQPRSPNPSDRPLFKCLNTLSSS